MIKKGGEYFLSVRIRLQRFGRPGKPFYRIVAIDSRKKRDGKPIEILGYLDPFKEQQVVINQARVDYWLDHGAQPSDRVRAFVRKRGGNL